MFEGGRGQIGIRGERTARLVRWEQDGGERKLEPAVDQYTSGPNVEWLAHGARGGA